MNRATISPKGQLVIPSRFRKALHLQAGDRVFSLEGDWLCPQREQPAHAGLDRGKFGRPALIAPAGGPPTTTDRLRALLNELP